MFDKNLFKELLEKAMGDLNTTEYAKESGVNRTYISKLLNKNLDNPPSPEIIKGLASIAKNHIKYTDFMKAAGYLESSYDEGLVKDKKHEKQEKYEDVHDIEEAMKIILEQPGLMLKGSILSDESKIILANAIQMGLRTAEEIEKKKNKGDSND